MKYIIDIPDNTHWIQWIMEGTKDHHPYMDWIDVKDSRFYTEHDRKTIEDEVWEFASMLMNMHSDVAEDIYWSMNGGKGIGVAAEMTYQEAKAKYEEWLKQKDEIHVGDEVEFECCGEVVKFIVTGVNGPKVYGFKSPCEYDDVGDYSDIDGLHKTGRTFPEVAELFEKMRGGEE